MGLATVGEEGERSVTEESTGSTAVRKEDMRSEDPSREGTVSSSDDIE